MIKGKIPLLLMLSSMVIGGVVLTKTPEKTINAVGIRHVLDVKEEFSSTIAGPMATGSYLDRAQYFSVVNPANKTFKIDSNNHTFTTEAPAATSIAGQKPSHTLRINDQVKTGNKGGILFTTTAASTVYIYGRNSGTIGLYPYVNAVMNTTSVVTPEAVTAEGSWLTFTLADAGSYLIATSATTYYNYIEVIEEDASVSPSEKVIAQIHLIGTVTYSKSSKDMIDLARSGYDALTQEEKASVSNLSLLIEAEVSFTALAEIAAQTFIEKVEAIGVVGEQSLSAIQDANEAYQSLLDAEKNRLDVVEAKAIWDQKETIFHDNYAVHSLTNEMLEGATTGPVVGSIYTVGVGSTVDRKAVNLPNGTRSVYRISTGGKHSATRQGVFVQAPSAGSLLVYFNTNSSDARDCQLFDTSGTNLSQKADSVSSDTGNAMVTVFTIPAAGMYQIGSTVNGINLYHIQFVAIDVAAQASITVQDNQTVSIRFIGLINAIENVESIGFTLKTTIETVEYQKVFTLHTVAKEIRALVEGVNTSVTAESLQTRYLSTVTLTNVPVNQEMTIVFHLKTKDGTILQSVEKKYIVEIVEQQVVLQRVA